MTQDPFGPDSPLMKARVVFWMCSKEHRNVKWEDGEDGSMTPHCLDCDEVGEPRR